MPVAGEGDTNQVLQMSQQNNALFFPDWCSDEPASQMVGPGLGERVPSKWKIWRTSEKWCKTKRNINNWSALFSHPGTRGNCRQPKSDLPIVFCANRCRLVLRQQARGTDPVLGQRVLFTRQSASGWDWDDCEINKTPTSFKCRFLFILFIYFY